METQLFCSMARPMSELFKPVKHTTFGGNKGEGGIWTSTWLPEHQTSAWIDWCEHEDSDTASWVRVRRWLLTPSPLARVYTIDSRQDLWTACQRYPRLDHMGKPYLINYTVMAQDYDAIHLTEEGQLSTHRIRSDAPDLNYWSCESTWWFRWMFTGEATLIKDIVTVGEGVKA